MAVYSMESTQENCYPGSTVLVNKFGLTDQNKLDIVERQIVLLKGAERERNAVFENVDFNYYKSIHKHLFEHRLLGKGKANRQKSSIHAGLRRDGSQKLTSQKTDYCTITYRF